MRFSAAHRTSNIVTNDLFIMPNGTRYVVLPCAEIESNHLKDEINEGLKRMSDQSRWLRFASAVTELSDTQLDYLTDLDGSDRVAWCAGAIAGNKRAGIGLARYLRLPDEPDTAEFAVSVVDEYQGQGVGRSLLEKLIESAKLNDIHLLRGYVLPQNDRMLGLAKRLQASTRQEDDFLCVEIPTGSIGDGPTEV